MVSNWPASNDRGHSTASNIDETFSGVSGFPKGQIIGSR